MGLEVRTTNVYMSGAYPFPKDEINPKDKNKDWGQQMCEAIWAAYVAGRTAIPYSKKDEMRSFRQYAAGEQDTGKYMKLLLDESEDGSLEGYMNLNWDIISVMPKFLHVIQGIFEDQEHAIVCTAVDPKSVQDKSITKLRKWFKSKYRSVVEEVQKMNGMDPDGEWLPESVDELNLYETMGGLKLAKETEMEEALQYTFYISDWNEIKKKLVYDAAVINCLAAKDYTDPYTKKVKTRYVDPEFLVCQYSRHWDHRNSEYAGELIQESISNIRKNTSLSEDTLRDLAQYYNGKGFNQNISSWAEDDLSDPVNGGFKYDTFMVDVLDAEWFSVDSRYRTARTNSRGETLVYDDDWGKLRNSENKKTEVHRYKMVYRCKWIIGTDFVYDFGLQYDVPRPGKKEVELSYKFYKLPGRSIVSLSVPNLDQIQLTWLKLQNALAMSSNKGVAVEYTSLQNMELGGQKMQPLEILSIRRDTGDLIYKLTTHAGKMNVPGGSRPIQELEGGIGGQLEEFLRLFEINLEFIRDLTGINRIADASTPPTEGTATGSQLAVAATSNALRPLYSAYIHMKEMVAKSCALRIQLLVKYSEEAYKGYIPVIGAAGVKIMSFDAENADCDYHLKIQAKPTRERKDIIRQAAIQAMSPDREGYVGIEYPDFLMVERLLEDGNLKYAEYFLAYRSQKNKQRQVKLQRENMSLDAENAQNTARVKGEEDRALETFKTDQQIRLKQAEAMLEDQNKANEHERKKELLMLQLQLKEQRSTQPITK